MSSIARASCLLFFALCLHGCTFFKELIGIGLEPPVVTLKNVGVDEISPNGIKLAIVLGLENRNDAALYLYSLNYTVETSEQVIATGDYKGSDALQAMGSTEVKIPLAIQKDALEKLVYALLNNQTYDVSVAGTAQVGTDYNTFTIPFKESRILSK